MKSAYYKFTEEQKARFKNKPIAELIKSLDALQDELNEKYNDIDFLEGAIKCEMRNHEYCFNRDDYVILMALGLSASTIRDNPEKLNAWFRAKDSYLSEMASKTINHV